MASEQSLSDFCTTVQETLAREEESLSRREEQLQADRNKLEAEKEIIMKSAKPGDILEINAGGTVVMVKRSALLMGPEDSLLHAMFSGRWDDSLAHGNQGRIFLEMTPEVFLAILSYLRALQNDQRQEQRQLPQIADCYRAELKTAFDFYGIPFLKPVHLKLRSSELTISEGSAGKSIEVSHPAAGAYACAVGVHALEDAMTWKVIVEHLPEDGLIYVGIVVTNPPASCHSEDTCFGWDSNGQVWIGGVCFENAWEELYAGDTMIFKLENQKLMMRRCGTEHNYEHNLPPSLGPWRLHLGLCDQGSVATVSTLTDDEEHLFK